MNFTAIDRANWVREEYFEHYTSRVPCTYSMTVHLDITNLLRQSREREKKLYPLLIYGISRAVNAHREFKMAIRSGVLGFYDTVHPNYTVFHREEETFSTLWTEYGGNLIDFYQRYLRDVKEYGHLLRLEPKGPREDIFFVSCLPWTSFTGFELQIKNGFGDLRPVFTLGKFFEAEGKTMLPLAVQVHHGVCDGFHLCRLVNELQSWVGQLTLV